MQIDRNNVQWSMEFVKSFFGFAVRYDGHCEGLSKMKDLFANRESVTPGPECPCWIFSYKDMIWDDPDQDICKPDKVVLSKQWPGEEEYIQVLTYERLKDILIMFLREEPNGDEQISDLINFIEESKAL